MSLQQLAREIHDTDLFLAMRRGERAGIPGAENRLAGRFDG
jgi:hypothetical protein